MNDKRYLREISITDDRESREPAMSPPKIREAETVKNNLRETWKAGKEIPEKRQEVSEWKRKRCGCALELP